MISAENSWGAEESECPPPAASWPGQEHDNSCKSTTRLQKLQAVAHLLHNAVNGVCQLGLDFLCRGAAARLLHPRRLRLCQRLEHVRRDRDLGSTALCCAGTAGCLRRRGAGPRGAAWVGGSEGAGLAAAAAAEATLTCSSFSGSMPSSASRSAIVCLMEGACGSAGLLVGGALLAAACWPSGALLPNWAATRHVSRAGWRARPPRRCTSGPAAARPLTARREARIALLCGASPTEQASDRCRSGRGEGLRPRVLDWRAGGLARPAQQQRMIATWEQ